MKVTITKRLPGFPFNPPQVKEVTDQEYFEKYEPEGWRILTRSVPLLTTADAERIKNKKPY